MVRTKKSVAGAPVGSCPRKGVVYAAATVRPTDICGAPQPTISKKPRPTPKNVAQRPRRADADDNVTNLMAMTCDKAKKVRRSGDAQRLPEYLQLLVSMVFMADGESIGGKDSNGHLTQGGNSWRHARRCRPIFEILRVGKLSDVVRSYREDEAIEAIRTWVQAQQKYRLPGKQELARLTRKDMLASWRAAVRSIRAQMQRTDPRLAAHMSELVQIPYAASDAAYPAHMEAAEAEAEAEAAPAEALPEAEAEAEAAPAEALSEAEAEAEAAPAEALGLARLTEELPKAAAPPPLPASESDSSSEEEDDDDANILRPVELLAGTRAH